MQTKEFPPASSTLANLIALSPKERNDEAKLIESIEADRTMAAQLLSAARALYFSNGPAPSDLTAAVTAIGADATIHIALCMAALDLSPGYTEYPVNRFWELSLRRAVAAQCLGVVLHNEDSAELFALGFCQDLGLMPLLSQMRDVTPEFAKLSERPCWIRREAELSYGPTHDVFSTEMLRAWGCSDSFTIPIEFHHKPDEAPEAHQDRAKLLYLADLLADLGVVRRKRDVRFAIEERLADMACEAGCLKKILDLLAERLLSASSMLKIGISSLMPTNTLLALSSATSIPANMTYDELSDELENALQEQQRLYSELQTLNSELEQKTLIDNLTKLPNRNAFSEAMAREIARARRIETPISALIANIDQLAKINEEHGFLAGDAVIREVSAILRNTVRTEDIPSRYTNEEFAVILPHTDREGAERTAERFVDAVHKARIEASGKFIEVSVSVGVATTEEPTGRRPEVLLMRSADDALFETHENGGNGFTHASNIGRRF